MSLELASIHPEVDIKMINKDLTPLNFIQLGLNSYNVIIIAVGSSDVQLRINKFMRMNHIAVPTFYCWLESDGESSHVAAIRNDKYGCFECLFTNNDGRKCNNIANISQEKAIQYIRNGCGGTRIPYGNQTLLTATALLLHALKDNTTENKLYSFTFNSMTSKPFPKNERCACCAICEKMCKI